MKNLFKILLLSILPLTAHVSMETKEIKSAPVVLQQNPQIVDDNSFETNIVADIVITQSPYNADSTGKGDCTDAIKQAISDLNSNGGGTIYFPKGQYRVTSSITVNNYVTLMGNYVDPDIANGDYGTVIVADVPFSSESLPALFRLRGSSGVVGMTIWYPGQCADDVRPFPYTFEIMGGAFTALEHMQFTIQNVTLINSFRGVAASRTINPQVAVGQSDAHENLVIENLKGTVLYEGINSVNESDIGYFKNIHFSSSYWANASCFGNSQSREVIETYTKQYGCGMKLGDLEWSPYYDIQIEGFKTGIHIIEGTRIQPDNPIAFMGGFYNLDIDNCSYGLVVDELYGGWGMLVSKGFIKGTVASVINNAPVGYVRLTDVELSGDMKGKSIYTNNAEVPTLTTKTPAITRAKNTLYNVVKDYSVLNDASADATNGIQNAINDAYSAGGGVVYLKAGYYKVSQPIEIKENVQLRGCMPITNRDNVGNSAGTVIFSYYDDEANNSLTDTALFSVGKNAGIYGLRICYPDNNLWLAGTNQYELTPTSFTVRLSGDNSYCMNVGLLDSYNGVEVLGDNCVVKNMPCLFFNKGIYVNGAENAHIENVFSNATIATQCSLNNKFPAMFRKGWMWKLSSIWNYYTYTEKHTTIITAIDSTNVNAMSIFTYCSAYLLHSENSTVFMNGCGGDRMWEDGFIVDSTKSTTTFVNLLKYHCMTSQLDSESLSKVNIYGRMNLNLGGVASTFESDSNVVNNISISDVAISDTDGEIVTYIDIEDWASEGKRINPLSDVLG